MSKLYFFRHGQASLGADNYDVLSPLGEEQALALGKYLVEKNIHFDRVLDPSHDKKTPIKPYKQSTKRTSFLFL